MTQEQLITKQQLEIEELKQFKKMAIDEMGAISNILYCCGGVLNDTDLKYTKEQLSPFFRIGDIANSFLRYEEEN